MATGGIFKLITNSGVQDKLLMATDYLNYRLKLIEGINKKKKPSNNAIDLDNSWLPDINMISKSHVIFVNNTFKPFVASGFEYNKAESSRTVLGSTSEYTIPQFGDFINDCVLHVELKGLSTLDVRDRVRYVSYLGHKLLSHVSFKVNGNLLDEYTSDDYNAFYEFHVPPNKRTGWMRNVGQEVPHQAFLTADPTFDLHREYKTFGDGNQTFKQSHDYVELWVPLLFWFKDIHNAVPTVAIPYGQTKISVTFATAAEIIGYADYGGSGLYSAPTITSELYINNIFMNPEIHNIFLKKFGFSLIRVHIRHLETVTNTNDLLLNSLKWPTECLYVAFRPRKNLELSQFWHKNTILTPNDIKLPVVAKNNATIMNAGTVTATKNTVKINYISGPALSNAVNFYNNYDIVITGGKGYSKTNIQSNRYTVLSYGGPNHVITITTDWIDQIIPDETTTFEIFTQQLAINVSRYYKETPTVNKIGIVAHGINIFNNINESFYNSYLPYRFGEKSNTPDDRGWYMINFNFYPGVHQPSGHINLSRAREFFIKYTSALISESNPVDLIVLADAINFLLIKNGSAVLRYST